MKGGALWTAEGEPTEAGRALIAGRSRTAFEQHLAVRYALAAGWGIIGVPGVQAALAASAAALTSAGGLGLAEATGLARATGLALGGWMASGGTVAGRVAMQFAAMVPGLVIDVGRVGPAVASAAITLSFVVTLTTGHTPGHQQAVLEAAVRGLREGAGRTAAAKGASAAASSAASAASSAKDSVSRAADWTGRVLDLVMTAWALPVREGGLRLAGTGFAWALEAAEHTARALDVAHEAAPAMTSVLIVSVDLASGGGLSATPTNFFPAVAFLARQAKTAVAEWAGSCARAAPVAARQSGAAVADIIAFMARQGRALVAAVHGAREEAIRRPTLLDQMRADAAAALPAPPASPATPLPLEEYFPAIGEGAHVDAALEAVRWSPAAAAAAEEAVEAAQRAPGTPASGYILGRADQVPAELAAALDVGICPDQSQESAVLDRLGDMVDRPFASLNQSLSDSQPGASQETEPSQGSSPGGHDDKRRRTGEPDSPAEGGRRATKRRGQRRKGRKSARRSARRSARKSARKGVRRVSRKGSVRARRSS